MQCFYVGLSVFDLSPCDFISSSVIDCSIASSLALQCRSLFFVSSIATQGRRNRFHFGAAKFFGGIKIFSDIHKKIFQDTYEKGAENNFSGPITKNFSRHTHFLNKILQIFPLIHKFSKNTLHFSLINYQKFFQKKQNFLGG